MIKIRVPATSANIGSGFDELGLAVELYAYVSFEYANEYTYEGLEVRYQKDNLIKEAYEYTCTKENFDIKPLSIHLSSDVPIARGLGSSSSLIVAGVTAALILNGKGLDKDLILKHAVDLEGHPDNVAPAIYGGLIHSIKENGSYTIHSLDLNKDLIFTFLIPDFELSTKLARSVLPASHPQEILDLASHKLKNLIKGLKEADMDLISDGCDDVIHQPYRFPLIKDVNCIKEALDKQNIQTLFLSGAGPTLGIITKEALNLDLSKCEADWSFNQLNIDHTGVKVL